MNLDVASRIAEQHSSKPGWWVEAARSEAAVRDGRVTRGGDPKPYSQMDIAMAIGRDRNTVWRWENDGIDYFSWMGLLTVLGIEPDWEPAAPAAQPTKKKSTGRARSH